MKKLICSLLASGLISIASAGEGYVCYPSEMNPEAFRTNWYHYSGTLLTAEEVGKEYGEYVRLVLVLSDVGEDIVELSTEVDIYDLKEGSKYQKIIVIERIRSVFKCEKD